MQKPASVQSSFLPCALGAAILTLLVSSTASASEPAEAPTKPEAVWYGWQPLIADGAAVVLATAGAVQALGESYSDVPQREHVASQALLGSAAVTFLFASPAIHGLHGQWGKAAISLGLRTLPVAVAVPLMSESSPHGGTWGMGMGVLLAGGLAALIIDDAIVAREPKAPLARTFAAAPMMSKDSAGLMAVGTF